MGLPYLKVQPEEAIQVLDECIVSGYKIKDQINAEYFQDRSTVNGEKITRWRDQSHAWADDCLKKLANLFVSQKELYEFRDAPVSPLMRVNTNVDWNEIINKHEAWVKRLTEYDRYIRNEFNVKVEVVGRDKIVQYGDNPTVDIKN